MHDFQAGYGGYIFSYAVKSIAGMSMNEAAYLNACFWGTFAFGRLLSIGIATRLAPNFMLLCNIVRQKIYLEYDECEMLSDGLLLRHGLNVVFPTRSYDSLRRNLHVWNFLIVGLSYSRHPGRDLRSRDL